MPLYIVPPDDHLAVVDLVNSAYRGDGSRQGWTTEADFLQGQRISAEMLAEDLDRKPDARVLAWRDRADGELLGCVWVEPAGEALWYLGMLTVRPDLQDRQLGRSLLDAAERWVLEAGGRRLRLTVINLRHSLIAWYERRGYALTGEAAPFPYHDRRFGDPVRPDLHFVVMEKALPQP